jgi:hypothetical protein
MEKIVPFFKTFTTMVYLKNFKLGKIHFRVVKIWLNLNIIQIRLKFEFESNFAAAHYCKPQFHPSAPHASPASALHDCIMRRPSTTVGRGSLPAGALPVSRGWTPQRSPPPRGTPFATTLSTPPPNPHPATPHSKDADRRCVPFFFLPHAPSSSAQIAPRVLLLAPSTLCPEPAAAGTLPPWNQGWVPPPTPPPRWAPPQPSSAAHPCASPSPLPLVGLVLQELPMDVAGHRSRPDADASPSHHPRGESPIPPPCPMPPQSSPGDRKLDLVAGRAPPGHRHAHHRVRTTRGDHTACTLMPALLRWGRGLVPG